VKGSGGTHIAVAVSEVHSAAAVTAVRSPSAEVHLAPLPWFALRVRPQQERSALLALRNKGLHGYLPLYRTRRRWSDRYKELQLPLFPGYLFCRFSPLDRLRVETTPSVLYIVTWGHRLEPVSDSEIAAVQSMLASGLPATPYPYLKDGDFVYIHRGPLQGLEGILVQVKSIWRVVVSVTLLQRSVAVEVDRETIAPSSRLRPRPLTSALSAYG